MTEGKKERGRERQKYKTERGAWEDEIITQTWQNCEVSPQTN